MAPGRVYLAVGTGEALIEYASTGAWPGYEERQARMVEAIDLIRQLWTGEPIDFDGDYYHTHQAKLYTRPEQAIPLYISTLVLESAAIAGRLGDGLITVGGEEPAVYRQLIQSFATGAREAGKDPAQQRRLIELNVAYTDDEAGIIKEMKQYWAGTFIPALFDQKIYSPALSEKNSKAVGSDTIKQKMCLSADPKVHEMYIQQHIDLVFDTIFFHCPGPDQRAFLEGYGRDVLPHLRRK